MIMKMTSVCNSSICIWLGTGHLTCRGGGGDYGFFRSEFFFGTTRELEYYFFPPEFNIRLYDKNSESDNYCFPPPKSEYFFSDIGNIGNQNIFLEKKT
jgi:hypothetical protein